MESKKALLIGVSEYASFPNLKFCEKDAKETSKVRCSGPLGYHVVNLVGNVKSQEMRDAIRDFFLGENVNSKDTLFYFSGHGVMDKFGNNYLASSQVDSRDPGAKGFWSKEPDEVIENSISQRKVIVLDCCYSGALGSIGLMGEQKGGEEEAKKGAAAIRSKIRSGTGKCILSACLDTQEAESTSKKDLSLFTYYLLEGLKGSDEEYVDSYGNVTTHLIGKYVYDKITSLPKSEKPKQIPIIKTEISGDIILATYPEKIKAIQRRTNGELLIELLQQGRIADFNAMRERDPFLIPQFVAICEPRKCET
jgi:Caspase domain